MTMQTLRLDLLLLQLGLASTRSKAQDLILEGKVLVDGKVIRKTGEKISPEAKVEITEEEHPYVSRGGLKLAHALKEFKLDVKNLVALDIGLSTGGFTHCLLLEGAQKVFGVDVGTAQVAPKIKSDPRVVVLENQDIRSLDPGKISRVDFFVADLSFISLTLVIPHLAKFLCEGAQGVLLVKPQFELGRNRVKNGIVKSAAAQEEAIQRVSDAARELGFLVNGFAWSPILGGDGNREFLLHVLWPGTQI